MADPRFLSGQGLSEPGVGQILGRCRLERVLGQGAMGVVWESRHLTLDILVAVKVLRTPNSSEDPHRFRERFRREARVAARLNHPGLVRVLDFGEEEGFPYIIMELVNGQTLDQYLRRKGILTDRLALQVVAHLCTALAVAHEAGIVHRDLKPANILLDSEGHLKISDLGLAREISASGLTAAEGIVGTPHYIAPETLESNSACTTKSDLYAVGVLLYQMVYGHPPFQGTTPQILHGHVLGTPRWNRQDGSTPDSGTLALIRRLLEKRPERRPPSAGAVVEACRLLITRLEGSSSKIHLRGGDSSEFRLRKALEAGFGSTSSVHDGAKILHTTGRERLLVWGMLAGLLAAAAAGFFFLGGERPSKKMTPASAAVDSVSPSSEANHSSALP